jgi:single-stranded DNA-binding protein
MIDALIAGKLYGQPKQMTGKQGKPFAIAKVRAAAGEGEALFVNVITFDPDTVAALLALGDGDSVALAGSLTPKVWTDKEGNSRPAVDLVAHKLLTAYHVTRKRNAVQKPLGQRQATDFDDDLSDI